MRPPAPKFLQVATAAFFAIVIAAYAGLIPLGQWQDEWDTIPALVRGGWATYAHRVLTWSPRPFSELILFGYAHWVDAAGEPLIAPVLMLLWLPLAISLIWVPSLLFERGDVAWWPPALSLFCLFLLGHPSGEMFYWPQGGGMAYLISLACIATVTWLACATGLASRRERVVASVLLAIAVLCAEVSAFFVLILAGFGAMSVAARRFTSIASAHAMRWVWLTPPLAAACVVLALGVFGRLGNPVEIFGDRAVAHHPVSAMLNSARVFAVELVSLDGSAPNFGDIASGLAVKGLFFLGIWSWARSSAAPRRPLTDTARPLPLFIGAAALATAFTIIAAAYYQFGVVCCERHGTFRQALVCLALFSFAWWLGRRMQGRSAARGLPALSPLCLLLAVVIAGIPSWGALLADYKSYPARISAAHANWIAGNAAGDTFTYVALPPGEIVGGPYLPAEGTFAAGPSGPGNVPHIIAFFRKKAVTFTAPPAGAAARASPR
ncbi:MAG TPA: hypothetical protein VHA82_11445 [Ramlibacter sp.]|uniref:hypothetical protein n=1 Tax=Ramlibacter sp. TaxID=1917967 RepID=UPI002C450A2A|nr:hypothetical protein [Ramlibacter sp.]HVZ44415.1 hypothetical protein [Ramlibacter sp.]